MRLGARCLGIIKESIDQSTAFFLQSTEKPMAVIELDGTIYEKNENFTRFFKIDQGQNIKRIIESQSLQNFEEVLKQLHPKQSVTGHFCMKVHYQQECTVKTNIYYNNETNLIILLFTIPTEIREDLTTNWTSKLNYTDSMLFLCNQKGHIQEVNHLSFEYFNLPQEYFIDKKVESVLSLFSSKSFDSHKFMQQILQGEQVEATGQYIHPIKNIQYYKITTMTLSTPDSFLLKITDDTETMMLRKQLKEIKTPLEITQLAATIVHEVRNPMTTLKGFTQLLKGTATEDSMRYLTVIEDEIERMESILNEMLTLSKPTKSQKKPLSLKRLLDEVIQVIIPKATIDKIQVIQNNELNEMPFVLGDEGRLKQVFLNLFKNGLEAMQSGGKLTIHLQHCLENQVNIIIEDTGKGIEEHNVTQVFLPYFTTKLDGTGLGMPFVLQTVEDHYGTISVSSEVGKGTSFMLTLPTL